MKRRMAVAGILLILGMVGFWMFQTALSVYNHLVMLQESVQARAADMQVQYQRRADLIPNLVEVVKGYAAHERTTLREVIEARSRATQVQLDPRNLDPRRLRKFMQAQGALSAALGRLMVVVERYPELKADARFAELQAQLEGTENRIAFARNQYNETVRSYNTYLRRFPAVAFASWFGFTSMPYFEAEPSAQTAPRVSFPGSGHEE